MARGRLRRHVLGGLGGMVGVLLIGLVFLSWNRVPTRVLPEPSRLNAAIVSAPIDDSDFVGSNACGVCHSRIWRQFHQHPMSRSLAAPLEAAQIERYDVIEFSPPGPRHYRVELGADGVRHHEILTGQDGSVVYDQGMDVSYALGSGKRGRAYLFEHDGMLFKSSIAWFSRRNAWGLAPDYLPASHQRFERRITDGCIACHAGRMALKSGAPGTFVKPVVIEASIGCERCHGPGRRHVEAHEAATDKQLADEFIINPARLDASRQISICAQCHLHGEARIMRTGQRPFDFQPGQLLEENRIVFVAEKSESDEPGQQSLSQVEQMLASACFLGSEGRMGCTSCHDPHGLPAPETRVDFYRQKCLACHETRGCGMALQERLAQDATDSCIACHMPASLQVRNVLHVSFADHRVPRHPRSELGGEPRGEPASPPATGDFKVFDQGESRLPKLELDRALAFLLVGGAEHKRPTIDGARRAHELLLSVHRAQPNDIDSLEILGAACQMQGRAADAEQWWLKTLKLDPRREWVLRQLGLLYHQQGRMKDARDYLQRYLKVNPWHGSIYGYYAGALGSLGEWRECIAASEHALELNPSLAAVHELLAHAYLQVGDMAESERHRELYRRIESLLPQARPPSGLEEPGP